MASPRHRLRLSPAQMYARVLAGDPAWNGHFFTGVLTTGIYCLPSCKARKPKRENIRFFPTCEAARAAGLRPCKKCHPDDFARGADPVLEAVEQLVAEVRADPAAFPDARALVRRLGFGTTRTFELLRLHYHTTPAELLSRARIAAAQQRLLATPAPLAEVAYGVGFESLSVLHEHFRRLTGLTPARYRELPGTSAFELTLPAGYLLGYLRRALSRDMQSVSERLEGDCYTAAVNLTSGPALLTLRLGRTSVQVEVTPARGGTAPGGTGAPAPGGTGVPPVSPSRQAAKASRVPSVASDAPTDSGQVEVTAAPGGTGVPPVSSSRQATKASRMPGVASDAPTDSGQVEVTAAPGGTGAPAPGGSGVPPVSPSRQAAKASRVPGVASDAPTESATTTEPPVVAAPSPTLEAHAIVVGLLGLEDDAASFARLARKLGLGRLTANRSELRISRTPTVFDGLVWAIIGQQINFAFACVLKRRLTELAGTRLPSGLIAPPTPAAIARLEPDDLLPLQFSRQKADYLIATARAITAGELDPTGLRSLSATRAERTLLALRGFGPWSVNYVMMRALGFADCVPLGDTGVTSGLQSLLHLEQRPDTDATRRLMAAFSPHRSLATAHLWQLNLPSPP